jgi:mannopine transport system substrate-binding protein
MRCRVALLTMSCLAGAASLSPATAQDRQLVVAITSGGYQRSLQQNFIEEFQRTSGIKVVQVPASPGERITKIRAMQQAGNVEWDLTLASEINVLANPDLFDKVDCGQLEAIKAKTLPDTCRDLGVLTFIGGNPLVRKQEPGQGGDATWEGFFADPVSVRRAAPNYGVPEYLVFGALQDKVRDNSYAPTPADVDLAFSKLDKIKSSIKVFWKTGDQIARAVQDGEASFTWMWIDTVRRLEREKVPITWSYDGAVPDYSYWVLVRGSKNKQNAMEFIKFLAERPEAHLRFRTDTGYDSWVTAMYEALPAEERKTTAALNRDKFMKINFDWVSKNKDKLLERWNVWASQ